MTKPIKFRTWDAKWKCWINPEDVLICSDGTICLDMHNYGELKEYTREEIILTQFTGVYDQNEREVFEGDILKAPSWGGDNILLVEFDSEIRCYNCSGDPQEIMITGFNFGDINTKRMEVIGNKFEHPHLLEGE